MAGAASPANAAPGRGVSVRSSALEVALGGKFEIGDQRLHGRIETVALDQLQGEAFLDVAGHDARGLEALAGL